MNELTTLTQLLETHPKLYAMLTRKSPDRRNTNVVTVLAKSIRTDRIVKVGEKVQYDGYIWTVRSTFSHDSR
jgi:hypothetical protein